MPRKGEKLSPAHKAKLLESARIKREERQMILGESRSTKQRKRPYKPKTYKSEESRKATSEALARGRATAAANRAARAANKPAKEKKKRVGRPLTAEHKEKMRIGRVNAAARRRQAKAAAQAAASMPGSYQALVGEGGF